MKLVFTLASSVFFALCFVAGILVGDGTLNYIQGSLLVGIGAAGAMVACFGLYAALTME